MARKLSTQDVEVQPPKSTSATRAALKDAAAKAPRVIKPRAKVAKPAKSPKAEVQRVPAAEVLALIAELGLSKSAFAKAIGKSPSSASEYVGHGRGKLLSAAKWPAYEEAARAFAKGTK